MTEDQRERRGGFAGCLAIGLLFGLPAYVLSIGPAYWLANHGYLPDGVGYVYAPLRIAIEYCQPLDLFLEWYVTTFWD